MSGIAIAGTALLAAAVLLVLVATVASIRRRRASSKRLRDVPFVGAAMTPPEWGSPTPPSVPAAAIEHEEREIPAGGPLTEPLPTEESAPEQGSAIETPFHFDPAPNERRRAVLLAGAATFAAGAALAWLLSRRRTRNARPT